MGVNQLEEHHWYDLYKFTEKTLAETNTVLFFPLIEYKLLGNGIDRKSLNRREVSKSTLQTISQVSDCRYILYVDFINRSSTTNGKAKLSFRLIDTKAILSENKFHSFSYEFQIIGHAYFIIPLYNPYGRTEFINISKNEAAAVIAFKKGVNKIKEAIVSKTKYD